MKKAKKPFKKGDKVVYNEKGLPYKGYNIYNDIMTVYKCCLHWEHFGRDASYSQNNDRYIILTEPKIKQKYQGWDFADNVRLLSPLEEMI